jgi:MtN3 and saliva related transmembrane protein
MQLTAVLAPVCTALTVSFVWPQVYRVYRLRTVEGLAPNGTMHGLCACTLWTMYGAARGIAPLILSNGAVGMAMLMIAAAQIRHRVLAITRLLTVLVVVGVVGAVALAISPVLAGWLAIVVGVTSIIPQTIHVSRSTELAGVSLSMYSLVLLSGVLWSLYGILIGDWLVVITNALIFPCALYVTTKAWRAQHPHAALLAELG